MQIGEDRTHCKLYECISKKIPKIKRHQAERRNKLDCLEKSQGKLKKIRWQSERE